MYTCQYVSTTVEVEFKGCTLYLRISGKIMSGGSNRYGSDEPEWSSVEDIEIEGLRLVDYSYKLVPLSKRLSNKLYHEFRDYFERSLIEASKEDW